MKKSIVMLLFALLICFLNSKAYALNWSINCTNGSCVGSAGRLTLYWTMQNPNASDESAIYNVQQVTGIKGLPFSINNFKQVQNYITKGVKENIAQSKTAYPDIIRAGQVSSSNTKSRNKNTDISFN